MVVEWPVAAGVYPLMGYLGWHFAYAYRDSHPLCFLAAVAVPTVSLWLTVWVSNPVNNHSLTESPIVTSMLFQPMV